MNWLSLDDVSKLLEDSWFGIRSNDVNLMYSNDGYFMITTKL